MYSSIQNYKDFVRFPSKNMVLPVIYLILFSTINLTNLPISSGSPSIPSGKFFSYDETSFIKSLTLSVLKGPGAILIILIFFLNSQYLKILKHCLMLFLN